MTVAEKLSQHTQGQQMHNKTRLSKKLILCTWSAPLPRKERRGLKQESEEDGT